MALPRDSISEKNKFRINCPVTAREVDYGSCLRTVQDHKLGKRSGLPECHACLHSSKCPAEFMLVLEYKLKEGKFFSETEKLGKIPEDIVTKVANTLVGESTCDRFGVPLDRRAVIGATKIGDTGWQFAHGKPALEPRIEDRQRKESPKVMPAPRRDASYVKGTPEKTEKPEAPKRKKEADFSGQDYSALVNKMVEQETKKEDSGTSSMSLLELARMKKG